MFGHSTTKGVVEHKTYSLEKLARIIISEMNLFKYF